MLEIRHFQKIPSGKRITFDEQKLQTSPYFVVNSGNTHSGNWKAVVWEFEGAKSLAKICFLEGKNKAALYPSFLKENEELQFPVVGFIHFLFVTKGKVEWFSREKSESVVLEEKDLLQITKTNSQKEYLNLKVLGRSSKAELLWGVIHRLSDY